MAITRYAGDRFTIADGETKPTGVLDGAYLIDTGNLTQFVRRTVGGSSQWTSIAGGGGGSPGGSNTQVQFNDNGAFGGTTGLTFDGQRLYANNFQLSGILYDSNASVGEGGMVLANEGATGVHWKNIESVLSGVGGSGVANYVARWSDEDTLTTGALVDDGTEVGIGTTSPTDPLQIVKTTAGAVSRVLTLSNYGSTDATATRLTFEGYSSTDVPKTQATIIATTVDSSSLSYTSQLSFSTRTSDALVIKTDGKVGIGTTAPSSRGTLEVVRAHQGLSAGNGGISVLSSDSWAIDKGGQIVFGGAISASDTSRTFGLIGGYKENTTDGNRAGYLQFGVREGTGAKDIVERMRIASEGNVGIGTIAPAETLHIDGTARIKPGTTGYFNFEGQGNLSVRMKNSSGNINNEKNNNFFDVFCSLF